MIAIMNRASSLTKVLPAERTSTDDEPLATSFVLAQCKAMCSSNILHINEIAIVLPWVGNGRGLANERVKENFVGLIERGNGGHFVHDRLIESMSQLRTKNDREGLDTYSEDVGRIDGAEVE